MTRDMPQPRGGQEPAAQAGTTSGTSREIADQAASAARQAAHEARARARNLTGEARHGLSTQLAGQKDRFAESLGGLAQSLRQTGQQLREHDQQDFSDYVDGTADQVERISGYLRRSDMNRMMDDAESLARREPALFVGGAFLLGFLGARFLKSSRPSPRYDSAGRYVGYGAQQGRSYTGYSATGYSAEYSPQRQEPMAGGARVYEQRAEE